MPWWERLWNWGQAQQGRGMWSIRDVCFELRKGSSIMCSIYLPSPPLKLLELYQHFHLPFYHLVCPRPRKISIEQTDEKKNYLGSFPCLYYLSVSHEAFWKKSQKMILKSGPVNILVMFWCGLWPFCLCWAPWLRLLRYFYHQSNIILITHFLVMFERWLIIVGGLNTASK